MCTQKHNAINPKTNQEYQIEYPGPEEVRQAILNDLEFPPDGITVKDATEKLKEKLELTDKQINAVNKSNLNVFRYSVVAPEFQKLLKGGNLKQPKGTRTPYFLAEGENIPPENETENNCTKLSDISAEDTTTRKAVDSEGNEYDIEMPTTSVVKDALCNFEYPPDGIRIKDITDVLAAQFELSDEQINARHRTGYNIFQNHVNTAANALVKSGKLLKIRRGWIINPDQFKVITPDCNSSSDEDTPSPEVVMEKSYQEILNNLKSDLLQKIKDNPPDFFEELVLDLLFAMGYGDSRADAEAVGRSGDGGIDGIISQDPLELDKIYIQAKRWNKVNVGSPDIARFAGALAAKVAKKGIFITTSDFTEDAKTYVAPGFDIVLINGNQLVQHMIKYNVGISAGKCYHIKHIDSDYFGDDEE